MKKTNVSIALTGMLAVVASGCGSSPLDAKKLVGTTWMSACERIGYHSTATNKAAEYIRRGYRFISENQVAYFENYYASPEDKSHEATEPRKEDNHEKMCQTLSYIREAKGDYKEVGDASDEEPIKRQVKKGELHPKTEVKNFNIKLTGVSFLALTEEGVEAINQLKCAEIKVQKNNLVNILDDESVKTDNCNEATWTGFVAKSIDVDSYLRKNAKPKEKKASVGMPLFTKFGYVRLENETGKKDGVEVLFSGLIDSRYDGLRAISGLTEAARPNKLDTTTRLVLLSK